MIPIPILHNYSHYYHRLPPNPALSQFLIDLASYSTLHTIPSQMRTLKAGTQLDVDQIIEKVMIRNTAQPYNYSQQHKDQLTPHEHLWHFQLQEENVELKAKIKELKRDCGRRQQVIHRQKESEKELTKVKN